MNASSLVVVLIVRFTLKRLKTVFIVQKVSVSVKMGVFSLVTVNFIF